MYVEQIELAAKYDDVPAEEQQLIDNNIDVEAMSPDTKQTRTRLSI